MEGLPAGAALLHLVIATKFTAALVQDACRRLPPYSTSAENPQSFFNVEVLPNASYRTVICPALDCAYAGEAAIAAAEISGQQRGHNVSSRAPDKGVTAHVNACATTRNLTNFSTPRNAASYFVSNAPRRWRTLANRMHAILLSKFQIGVVMRPLGMRFGPHRA